MQARTVPLSSVAQWYRRGWDNFRGQPGPWIVLVLLYALFGLAAPLIPVLGPVLLTLITPALAAGLLHAAREGDAGREVRLRHLFAGLTAPGSRMPLLLLGGLLLAWTALWVAIYFSAAEAWDGPPRPFGAEGEPSAAGALTGLALLAAGLAGGMALYFAVPLVHFGRRPVFGALGASLLACLRNLAPLLAYGVSYSLLAAVASIPFGLGLIVLTPVGVGANWASFTDIFPEEDPAQPSPTL